MKQTDEQIAKEYLKVNWTSTYLDAFIGGLKKGRELEQWKAMRFAEWTQIIGWSYNTVANHWYSPSVAKNKIVDISLTEELYNSQEFAEYLKQFEK